MWLSSSLFCCCIVTKDPDIMHCLTSVLDNTGQSSEVNCVDAVTGTKYTNLRATQMKVRFSLLCCVQFSNLYELTLYTGHNKLVGLFVISLKCKEMQYVNPDLYIQMDRRLLVL